MIQLPSHIILDTVTLTKLQTYQNEIDLLPSFAEKSRRAKDAFSNRNKKGNSVFDAIKIKLTEMCSGARRCAYCEDSVADEVEHIHPKDLYPEMCFHWENYVYACGSCNGPKNNKFAVFRKDDGTFQIVNPPKGQEATQPPVGEDVMINPRIENPMDFCMLDLFSFDFAVKDNLSINDTKKADYTFNEILHLNREFLRVARENVYNNYKSRLGYYSDCRAKGADEERLGRMIANLKREGHPSVWKEMQRQHQMGILEKVDNHLDQLFIQSLEALGW